MDMGPFLLPITDEEFDTMPRFLLPLLFLVLTLAACQPVDRPDTRDILAVMQEAQDGWNAGDLEAYMGSYWQSPELRFAGGARVSHGWEEVLKNYQASYPDRAAMGHLRFSEMQVDLLSGKDALVFGRWQLTRQDDQPQGLFTLHLKRLDAGWKIVADHTSSGASVPLDQGASIDRQGLMEKIQELTDPACAGRLPGTSGYDLAARRMAAHFADLGLQPGGDDRYFQTLTIEANTILPGCVFTYENGDHERVTATLDEDYLFRGFSGSGQVDAPVVFCGYGISEPARGYDDYADIDVQGQVVLVFKQSPRWKIDDEGWGDWSYPRPKAQAAFDHGAVAVLMVSRPNDERPQPLISSMMHGDGEQVDIPQLQISHEVAGALLGHTGLTLSVLQTRIDEGQEPQSRELNQSVQITVSNRYHKEADTANVVAILPGTDPLLKHEHLVIGAHLDHVGAQAGTALFAGANDNASGSAAAVEMAEAFVRSKTQPRRSVVFVLFTGEEQGLIGSRYYAENPALPLDKAVAMFNLDCVAHGDSIQIWGGKSSPSLWDLARNFDAADEGLLAMRTGGGGGADAAPFHQLGLPTLYFTSKYSYTHLHRTSDTIDTLNPELFTTLTRVAYRTAAAVADGRYQREELLP
jgi:ketosteroid isomerase-like protein